MKESREILFGGMKQGGRVLASLDLFKDGPITEMYIPCRDEDRAKEFAATWDGYRGLRFEVLEHKDTSHVEVVFELDGEIAGVLPDERIYYGVKVTK